MRLSTVLARRLSSALFTLLFITGTYTYSQTSVFTHQGRLTDGAMTANANYDFQVVLFDVLTGGSPLGTNTILGVPVSAGIYTLELDYAAAAFSDGGNRFLEIRIKRPADAAFSTLTPRQQIRSSPYSVRALNAGTANTATNSSQLGGVAAVNYLQTNGNGFGLTNLNATNITSGTLDNARLGVVSIANGGTGSATQNFVDLTTAQTIAGAKTFSGTVIGNVGVSGINSNAVEGSRGVDGSATGAGEVFGVQGQVGAATLGSSAGVRGLARDAIGDPNFGSGVLGVGGSGTTGVVGIGNNQAVVGINLSGASPTITTTFGALGRSDTVAVFGSGDLSITGTKAFVEPHPTDPNKVIRYVALEGPEAGTYFRGRGKFEGNRAVIEVPESFRMVTAQNGLSIQITPIGEMATVAVVEISLGRIVVKASQDVEFFYTVNGVRLGFENLEVITKADREFTPTSPDAKMPTSLSPVQKQRLIATGIYNADGTVNLATARKYGWDKHWDK